MAADYFDDDDGYDEPDDDDWDDPRDWREPDEPDWGAEDYYHRAEMSPLARFLEDALITARCPLWRWRQKVTGLWLKLTGRTETYSDDPPF